MTVRNTSTRDRHRAMIARGKPPCWICGEQINFDLPASDPMSFVVDHVEPLSRGGADELSNKRASHRACNRAKSDKDYATNIIKRSRSVAWPD